MLNILVKDLLYTIEQTYDDYIEFCLDEGFTIMDKEEFETRRNNQIKDLISRINAEV